MATHFFHSGMTGAPTNTSAAGSTLDIIRACLATGFNLQTVQSASVASGVMTLGYAGAHGYEDKVLIRLDGVAGGSIVRRVTLTGASTLTISAAEFSDGAVAGTLSTRVAPADWEEPFSGTNIGVFRSKLEGPGSTRFYYRVQDTASAGQSHLLRGYESMLGADTGNGPFPTLSQIGTAGLAFVRSNGLTPRPWVVVADQRTCYICLADTGTDGGYCGAFGDMRSYNSADAFFALAAGSTVSSLATGAATNCFVARQISGIGSSVTASRYRPFESTSGQTGRPYPSPVDGGMVFARPILSIDTNAIRGEMRGLMHCSAQSLLSGSFFTVFPTVAGIDGRVVVVRDNGATGSVAFPVDEDWA